MRKLSTIQKRENLNHVYAVDEQGKSGANEETEAYITIQFQNGARKLPDSIAGVLDTDLLEIVRDRRKGFQICCDRCQMWFNLDTEYEEIMITKKTDEGGEMLHFCQECGKRVHSAIQTILAERGVRT